MPRCKHCGAELTDPYIRLGPTERKIYEMIREHGPVPTNEMLACLVYGLGKNHKKYQCITVLDSLKKHLNKTPFSITTHPYTLLKNGQQWPPRDS